MIIFALIIVTFAFFICWNCITNHGIRIALEWLTTVLLVACLGLITANFKYHYGMHRRITPVVEAKRRVNSMANQMPTLLYKPLGSHLSHLHRVYIYRNVNHHVKHTKVDASVYNLAGHQSGYAHAYVKVLKYRWAYNGKMSRFWFGLIQHPRTYKTVNKFCVPKAWSIMSIARAKAVKQQLAVKRAQLKKKLSSPRAKQAAQQQAKQFVQGKMMAAMKKDPKMSSQQKIQLKNRLVKQYRDAAKRKLVKQLLASVRQ